MVRQLTLSNGRQIEMRLSDEQDEITFYENNVQLDGDFKFEEDEEFNPGRYLLKRMYSPIPRQGIGQKALEFFIEVTDGIIWTRPDNGQPRDDQSHLTDKAPAFVRKMQKLDLIEPWEDDEYTYDF